MKYLKELRLGGEHLTTTTFQPTEAEQAVLFNVSELSASDRPITKQDAINVPQETIEKKAFSDQQLAAAFNQLVNLNLLNVDEQGLISLTDAGQQEVDQIEQSRDFEEPKDYEGGEGDEDIEGLDDLGAGEGEPGKEEPGKEEPGLDLDIDVEKTVKKTPMESFTLLQNIVESAKTKEELDKLKN